MGYNYCDANGHIKTQGPSISGWKRLRNLVDKKVGHPALEQLIEHGFTNLLVSLSAECESLAKKTRDKDLKFTLMHLADVARKAEEIVFLEY